MPCRLVWFYFLSPVFAWFPILYLDAGEVFVGIHRESNNTP